MVKGDLTKTTVREKVADITSSHLIERSDVKHFKNINYQTQNKSLPNSGFGTPKKRVSCVRLTMVPLNIVGAPFKCRGGTVSGRHSVSV